MSGLNTFWGNISASNEDATEPETETVETETPAEDTETVDEGGDDVETETPEETEEVEEPAETPETPEIPAETEAAKPEEVEVLETLSTVESLLEKEELMFLDSNAEYDNSAKGLAKMMRDNLEGQRTAMEIEFQAKLAAELAKVEKAGAPLVSDMDPENESHAEEMVTKYYDSIGMTEDEIKERIAENKDLDRMTKEATIAQRQLAKREAAEIKAAEAQKKEEESKKANEVALFINDMKSQIDEMDEMAGFELTNKIKKGFKDYLFKEDKKTGLTPAQEASKDPSRRMRLAFMDFMDYNKKDFEIKARTEAATELTKTTSRFKSKSASTKGKPVKVKEDKPQEEFKKGFLNGFFDPKGNV